MRRTPRSWMTWTRRTRRIPTTASRSTPWPFRVEPRRASTVGPTRSQNYYSAPRQRMLTSSVTRRAGRPQPPSSPRVASWLPSLLPMDGLVQEGRPGVDTPSPATAWRRVPEMGLESSQLRQLPKLDSRSVPHHTRTAAVRSWGTSSSPTSSTSAGGSSVSRAGPSARRSSAHSGGGRRSGRARCESRRRRMATSSSGGG